MWQPQSCAITQYLEILFGIVFTKFMIYFKEEIGDFWLCCGRFFPVGIQAYLTKILNCSANESKTLVLSDQSLEGRWCRCLPGKWEVEMHRVWFGRSGVVFREDREVSSAKTAVWLLKENKVISINQLKLQGAWEISCYGGASWLVSLHLIYVGAILMFSILWSSIRPLYLNNKNKLLVHMYVVKNTTIFLILRLL